MARFLDVDHSNASILVPIFQRQRNVLNFTYWHAIILTHRPFMLSSFARLSRQGANAGRADPQTEESVRQCLHAAMNTVKLIDSITQNRQMFRAFWVSHFLTHCLNGSQG
jgi:hypothetical protein